MTFERRSEGDEGGVHVHMWEKSGQSTGNGQCKGPEAGAGLCSSEASQAGESEEVDSGNRSRRSLWIVGRTLTFILSEMGTMASSKQRDVTWGIVVGQVLCSVISMSLNHLSLGALVPLSLFLSLFLVLMSLGPSFHSSE